MPRTHSVQDLSGYLPTGAKLEERKQGVLYVWNFPDGEAEATIERLLRRLRRKSMMLASHVKRDARSTTDKAKGHTNAQGAPKVTTGSKPAHVYLLLDDSGSMRGEKVVAARQQAQTILTELGDTQTSVTLFGENTNITPFCAASKVNLDRYGAHQGSTRLYETMLAAFRQIDPTRPTLLYVLTDGEDTTGETYKGQLIKQLQAAKASKHLTIAVFGPKNALSLFEEHLEKGCVKSWGDPTKAKEVRETTAEVQRGTQDFVKSAAKGEGKVGKFFVNVDIKAADRKNLIDITSKFTSREVTTDGTIKDFVEKVLHKTFIPGAAYIQLYRKETLREGRAIVLMERGKKVIYGGPEVRKILNLPEKGECTIEPRNMNDWIVFIQSASDNRSLQRSTRVLWDNSHVPGATSPTWAPYTK
jgi:uncharacterized protein YegL